MVRNLLGYKRIPLVWTSFARELKGDPPRSKRQQILIDRIENIRRQGCTFDGPLPLLGSDELANDGSGVDHTSRLILGVIPEAGLV